MFTKTMSDLVMEVALMKQGQTSDSGKTELILAMLGKLEKFHEIIIVLEATKGFESIGKELRKILES